ncbi:MAG TPA: ATP-binding protein, partial [Pirellulales bacterium]|nr:ATP-binding protein [Pirellulales bacterium]
LDVTDRKQLEEQLRQSQRMEAVGRLVGGIAHDFNNFLTAINIYNELLTDSLGSNLPALQLLREVKDAVERSAGLTRQLLAFGGKQPLAPQTFCLNDVVRDAEPMLRLMIGADVQLEAALEPQLAPTKADPEQLERVLVNLVVNARHATPEGGKITIESANVTVGAANDGEPRSLPAGRYVALSVTDTGAGMSDEIKPRIFDPYFTTKGPEKGTGLGLAVAQGIVKQLKGSIEVESEPGCGARFTIYLPSAEQPTPHESSATCPPRLRRAETILFVDRDKSLRKATCELLQQFGFEPLEASSSEEAMLMSSDRRQPISMIVTGSSFSREESQALTEQLLALRPKLKSLCLADGAERPQLRGDGAHELPPPHGRSLTPVSLSEKIRQALDGK